VFAELCVSRQVVSAVRTAMRHKHRPLNRAVSLHQPVRTDSDGERTLADVLAAPAHDDPAERVQSAERLRELRRHLDTALSDLEGDVLELHVAGASHGEIAGALKRGTKAVDSALRRVRHKLEAHLVARDAEIA
jgi:RNA polymerase sporulation-specific sigma factor